MPVDVPAYVLDPPRIESHVQVVGGNNWDLSRSARITPVVVIVPPPPVVTPVKTAESEELGKGKVPAGPPLLTVQFSDESSTISKPGRERLAKLPQDATLIVVGHGDSRESDADRLSRARAKAVTTMLRAAGFTVITKAVGSRQPTLDSIKHPAQNRVVEIFRAGL